MRIRWLYGLLTAAITPALADADFMSVRTKLAVDWSGKGREPAEKYFRELTNMYLNSHIARDLI
jgi:hypothetical protein